MGDRGQDTLRRDKKIGPYLVGTILGKGGFGSVYKALDQERAHFVAIKQVGNGVLSSGDLGSIEMEISLLSKLKHRNIVKYIDSIRTEHYLNIVLEYVEGGSLASILKKFGAFPETLCAIYTLQILKGLMFLHSQGVIHRDIKGANVLTTKMGLVKLADFGVATKLSEVDNSKRRVVGTPYWMAPEIIEMTPPTPACDIWSVGSTVIEMITEKPPYADLQQVSALYRIVSDPHPPLPDCISQPLESFLLLCYEKNPTRRAGAGELVEHGWIEANRKHTRDFTRKMMPADSKENLDYREDTIDDEMDADNIMVSTFLENVTANEDPKNILSLIGSSGADGNASVVAKSESSNMLGSKPPTRAKSKQSSSSPRASPPPSARPPPQAPGPVHPQEEDPGRGAASTPGAAGHAEVAEGTGAGASEGRGGGGSGEGGGDDGDGDGGEETVIASDSVGAIGCASFEAIEDVASGSGELSQNQYHFAFLDYYHKMHATAKQAPPPASDKLLLRLTSDGSGDAASQMGRGSLLHEGESSLQRSDASADRFELPISPLPCLSSRSQCATNLPCAGGHVTPLLPAPAPERRPPPLGNAAVVAHSKEWQREAAEIKQLLSSIRPFEEPGVLVGICKRLVELLQHGSRENLHLVMQHGAVPIVEMLQLTDPALLRIVLRVVNQIVEGNQSFQEIFAMVGLIPGVIKFARPHHSRPLRYEAACFISRLCHTSPRSLQLLVACGGLEALVDLVSHDYYHNRDLVWLALDALEKVFDSAAQKSHNADFCRILAKHGVCVHLVLLVDTLAGDIHERAARYLRIVVDLLLLFATEGDAIVKVYMAKGAVLEGLIAALEFLPPDLAVRICKTFKRLAQEPSILNMLENAGLVPVLVHLLSQQWEAEVHKEDAAALKLQDPCSQCLLALFYLCKLSRPRQEQAALAGIVPLLQGLVEQRHALRAYAFGMLCDTACASLAARRLLWSQGGVAFLTRSLAAPDLQTPALEALVGWLGVREHRADWCTRLEAELLEDGDFLGHLVRLFRSRAASVFMNILDPLLKLARVSRRINAALAGNDDFLLELVQRLEAEPHWDGSACVADGKDLPGSFGTGAMPCQAALSAAEAAQALAEAPAPVTSAATLPLASAAAVPPVQLAASLGVQRRHSEPAIIADDNVRARKTLLRLLLLLCEAQGREQLAIFCQRYRLQLLMHHVLDAEQRKQRVILCEIASQLLELFRQALPTEVPHTIS